MIPADSPEPTGFDARLRAAYQPEPLPPGLEPAPWSSIASRLPAAPLPVPAPRLRPRAWRPALVTGFGGVILGFWLSGLGGLSPQAPSKPVGSSSVGAASSAAGTNPQKEMDAQRPVSVGAKLAEGAVKSAAQALMSVSPRSAHSAGTAGGASASPAGTTALESVAREVAETSAAGASATPRAVGLAPVRFSASLAPTLLQPLLTPGPRVVPALQPLVAVGAELASLPAVSAADSSGDARARRTDLLLTQRAALRALQHQTDSLLLTLGVPSEHGRSVLAGTDPLSADSVGGAAAGTVPRGRRWSVALAFAPEHNYFGLQAPVTDTLVALRRTHETGRAGYNAAVLAEYRVSERLSVAGGVGVASYGAELRLTDRQTSLAVRYDTLVRDTMRSFETTTTAFSIREDSIKQPTPIYNGIGQVIGFDSVWVTFPDTVWTTLHNVYSLATTSRTVTPHVTKTEQVRTRILRPNYRFLTLPVLLRYRLTAPGGRWWADVAGGAQLQLFLGGTQLVTHDGRTYQTQRVKPGEGPFRPLNVALMGSVGFNYALTPRLSASFSPTIRWQAASVYKATTNLTQKPTTTGVQLGLRWQF